MKIYLRLILGLGLALLGLRSGWANGYVNSLSLGNNGGTTSSLTTSYTVTSGDLLLVFLTGDVTGGSDNITSVTYNAIAMTLVNKVTTCGSGGSPNFNRIMYLYQLASPTSGAHNVVITAGSSHYILAGAAEYNGTTVASPIESSNTNNSANAATTLTTSTTTTTANDVLVQFYHAGAGTMANPTAPATRRLTEPAFSNWAWADSTLSVSIGSNSITANSTAMTAGAQLCAIQAAVKFNAGVPNQSDASKINSYTVLNSIAEDASKVNSYVVLNRTTIDVSKVNAYAVVQDIAEDVSKVNAYAVLCTAGSCAVGPPPGSGKKLMFKSGPGW